MIIGRPDREYPSEGINFGPHDKIGGAGNYHAPGSKVSTPHGSKSWVAPHSSGGHHVKGFYRTWKRPETPAYATGKPFMSRYKPHIEALRQLESHHIQELATKHNENYPEAAAEIAKGHGAVHVSMGVDKYGKSADVVFNPIAVLPDGGHAGAGEPMVSNVQASRFETWEQQAKRMFKGMKVPVHVSVHSSTGGTPKKHVFDPK